MFNNKPLSSSGEMALFLVAGAAIFLTSATITYQVLFHYLVHT